MTCQALPTAALWALVPGSQLQCRQAPGSSGEKPARGEADGRDRNHGDLEGFKNKHQAAQRTNDWEPHPMEAAGSRGFP